MTRLRRWLLARRVVQKALATPTDLQFLRRPSPRVLLGLILLGASYIFGWPAIIVLGAVATWIKQPKLLLVGPPVYGFSWALFALGLALIGRKSISAGRAFGLRLLRRFAEKFLLD
jgi:hypothetical protein